MIQSCQQTCIQRKCIGMCHCIDDVSVKNTDRNQTKIHNDFWDVINNATQFSVYTSSWQKNRQYYACVNGSCKCNYWYVE
jgi:hypothetical protein